MLLKGLLTVQLDPTNNAFQGHTYVLIILFAVLGTSKPWQRKVKNETRKMFFGADFDCLLYEYLT